MRIETRDMGAVDVAPEQVVDFVCPILGFESYKRFAIVPIPKTHPFHWLQSLEERHLAFPLVSADELHTAYKANPEKLRRLGADSWDKVKCWIIVAVPPDGGPLRPNLTAPVVVNPENRLAAQIIVNEPTPRANTALPKLRSAEQRTASPE